MENEACFIQNQLKNGGETYDHGRFSMQVKGRRFI